MELTLSNIITIIGMPSVFSIVVYLIGIVNKYREDARKKDKEISDKVDTLMTAYQMQMRDGLFKDYKLWVRQGWVDIDDLEQWESRYQAYHGLGENGVMDAKRDELFALPNSKPKKPASRKPKNISKEG